MDIQIRELQKSDCAIVAEHLQEFDNGVGANYRTCEAQETGEGLLLVAWLDGGTPVGRLWIRWAGCHEIPRIRDTHPVARTIRDCPSFNEIEVAERLRGRGIGTQLIRHAEVQAKKQGFRRASMTALHDGRPRKLYERLGYSDPGIGVFHTFGTYTNEEGEEVPWDNGHQVFLIKELYRTRENG